MAATNYTIVLQEPTAGNFDWTISRNSATAVVDATSGAPNRLLSEVDAGPNAPLVEKVISGATNATPIVLTVDSGTGLANGDWVRVEGVLGNTNANGDFRITISGTSVTLVGSASGAAYTSGGRLVKLNRATDLPVALAKILVAIQNDRAIQS